MTPGNDLETVDFLPHDLITEILSWLPVEPLLRFKTVCKLWRDTIQEQNFTHLHMGRCSLIYPQIMWEVYTVKPDSVGNTESFTNLCSLNGIMLERCSSTDKYRIRNPLTKHVLHLPSPKHIGPAIVVMMFVFVVKTKEYKLVCYLLHETAKSSGFKVLTLIGTDSTWRPLDDPTNLHYANHGKVVGGCRYVDDVLYILGRSMDGHVGVNCLDMATEQLKEVALPSCLFPDWSASLWSGKFSITAIVQEQVHAWILEDYKKCKWGVQKMVIPPFILKEHPHFKEYQILYIAGYKLAFLDEGRITFVYDIKCGKNRYFLSVEAPGNKNRVGYRPSMVHFRGMQPEQIQQQSK